MMKRMLFVVLVALWAIAPGFAQQDWDPAGTPMLGTGETVEPPEGNAGNRVAEGEYQPPSTTVDTVDTEKDVRGQGTYVPPVPKPEAPSLKPRIETITVEGREIVVRGGQVYIAGIGLVSVAQARQIARQEVQASTRQSQSPSRSSTRSYHHRRYNAKGYTSNLAQLWAGLKTLDGRLTDLEQAVSTVKGWVQTLAKRVDTHEARLDDVEKRLGAIDHQPAYGAVKPVAPKGRARPSRVKIAPTPPDQVETPSDAVLTRNIIGGILLAGFIAWLLRKKPTPPTPPSGPPAPPSPPPAPSAP